MRTIRFSEQNELLAWIDPDSIGAGATTETAWVDASGFGQITVLMQIGDMAAGATLVGLWQQATDNEGTGAKAIAGASPTPKTQAGLGYNQVVCAEFLTDQLDTANGYRYAMFSLSAVDAAVECAAVILGSDPRSLPVSTDLLTEVVSLP